MKGIPPLLALAALATASVLNAASEARLLVHAGSPGARINPSMWGVFFEDINFGADGGLYAELVKNGSFEFPDPRMGWKKLGDNADDVSFLARVDATPANRRCAQIHSDTHNHAGLGNEGFRGIGVKAGESYDFSLDVRTLRGTPKLRIELVGKQGVLASALLDANNPAWSRLETALTATSTEAKASLQISPEGEGIIEVDHVSLFPRKTWKNRRQGLRADMVQMLADLKPGFVRFPGGCIVEGRNLDNRYQWKKTILPREERELILNRWNNEMKDHQAPDYYQSFGLGFFEYFQLCDDIGAEPMPILNCGMACQYNTSEMAPLDGLEPYIQDALDLIEFANGPVTSSWGAKRAAMGHPAPFGMKLLGVGNEQWGPHYVERFQAFAKVLKSKYPEVALIAAAGPYPKDKGFDYLWGEWRRLKVDLVDEHSYQSPSWFFQEYNRFDAYARQGPKVLMGEYACHTKDRTNSLEAALAEAAFMLGMERNADVVRLAAYAPLFAHVDAWQWRPDMIWVDNLRVMGTPSYYVQKLFANNRGDRVVPVSLTTGDENKLFASAVLDEGKGELILKVVNPNASPVRADIILEGLNPAAGPVRFSVLGAASANAENTLDAPTTVAPVEHTEPRLGNSLSLQGNSLTLVHVPLR